jgi:hypothetical protein
MTIAEQSHSRRKLFVVTPLGDPGSSTRKLADVVFDFIQIAVGQSYDSYELHRGATWSDESMLNDILESLEIDPLVIAYLGAPGEPFNANVMLETGYRMATGRPLVVLAHNGVNLPFDLKQYPCVMLPPVATMLKTHRRLSETCRDKDGSRDEAGFR